MARKANPKTHWERHGKTLGAFPPNKYNFSEHLKKLGDYVETYPLTWWERECFRKAAHFWAWQHKCRVKVNRILREDGICSRATLISKVRIRDYK